jgi:hypothetical protein
MNVHVARSIIAAEHPGKLALERDYGAVENAV